MTSDRPAESPSEEDLRHLQRCVELARMAVEQGDQPFGSVLVDATGTVLFEDHNRIVTGDATRHPELEIARWAAQNLTEAERSDCRVYTSGEHCPMCSAAHAVAGLGPIYYVASSAQLSQWRQEWGLASRQILVPLSIQQVAPNVNVRGPVPELEDEIRSLHARSAGLLGDLRNT